MPDQSHLFDVEGVADDLAATLGDAPHVRPARVGFLAAMLAVWTLGPGHNLSAREREAFKGIARDALDRARQVGG